jgi:hypothetical protein
MRERSNIEEISTTELHGKIAHPGTGKTKMSRLALRPTQPPIQWEPGFLPGVKVAKA